MAIFKSQLVTQISGSVGGTTYSRNRSGMYMRARAVPVDPASGNQLEVRSAMTTLVTEWLNTLTAAQRSAWSLWASNTPFTNPLGDQFNISGQNAYIGSNVARLQSVSKLASTLLRVDAAPTVFDRGTFTTPVPTWTVAGGLSLAFTIADDWHNEDDAAMILYQGKPQNASRNFFKGPFRMIGVIEGAAIGPPASPVVITPATLAAEGFVNALDQNQWLAVAVVRADGRYSTRRIIGPDVVAA